jgi:hypothetical protein
MLCSSAESLAANDHAWTRSELAVLKTCEGAVQLFKQFPDSIWRGYDLSKQPFVAYVPDQWALLMNATGNVEQFAPYPADWPNLGSQVRYHIGRYGDLGGQLAFDLPVDGITTVAIGFPTSYDTLPHFNAGVFGTFIHEAFHQYQHAAFGDIPWEREERYPILDRNNTSLVVVEMRLLEDALKAMKTNDRARCAEVTRQFVAVRNYRWSHADPIVARYEQGQEINEGTAQYVGTKGIELAKRLRYESSLAGLTTTLQDDLSHLSFPDAIMDNMHERLTGISLSPDDVPRNRIYPVGCAQGYLLDYFKVPWKESAQKAGPEFTFMNLLRGAVDAVPDSSARIIEDVKDRYKYETILSATDSLIHDYQLGFDNALTAFEAQPGQRVTMIFTTRRLSRSRSSMGKKWTMDRGARALCNGYRIYTLKGDSLAFELRDAGVYEQTDWDAHRYEVAFVSQDSLAITLDGMSVHSITPDEQPFARIAISSPSFSLTAARRGTFQWNGREAIVKLLQ